MHTSTKLAAITLFLLLGALILGFDLIIKSSAFTTTNGSTPEMLSVAGRANMRFSVDLPGSPLLAHEIAHMRYMREEEKLARDVYLVFSNRWGSPIFGKIAQAEQRHTEAVLTILNRYGVPDPAASTQPGQFTEPGLAALYPQLIQKGSRSLPDALLVGGLIEEVDIADLENATASTTRPDIITVYETIHRGSRNHLRSFSAALAQLGIPYQPQKLKPAEVAAILASPMEKMPLP